MIVKRWAAAVLIAMSACATAVWAQQPGVAAETIEALEARVASLKQRIKSSGKLIAGQRQQLIELEKNAANAEKNTNELIAKFQEIINEFETGGATSQGDEECADRDREVYPGV